MLEVRASTCAPSASSARAKYSPSSTQKSRLKRRLRSAASFSSRSAKSGSFQTCARQAGAAHLGVVGVALQLAGGAREARQAAVAVGDRVPGVLPALVLEAGLLVAALVGDVAVALQVGVLVDPVQGGARLGFELAHERRCRRSSARTRRAGPRTAGWRRRCRSRASAAAPRRRSSRRSASRAGSGPGPRRGSRRRACPARCRGPAACVAASSGVNGSACRLVKMLSRPNIVMNQGRPAAGRLWPASDGRREAQRRQVDEAALVGGLERVPVAQQRGASSSHWSRLRSMLGLAFLASRPYLGCSDPATDAQRRWSRGGRSSIRRAVRCERRS